MESLLRNEEVDAREMLDEKDNYEPGLEPRYPVCLQPSFGITGKQSFLVFYVYFF